MVLLVLVLNELLDNYFLISASIFNMVKIRR